MLRVGTIGYGYWGPNVVRNFKAVDGVKVTTICDKAKLDVSVVCEDCPHTKISTDAMEVIRDPEIDIIAIVTPVSTHFELAKAALENGKHVFVEKPFTQTREQAEELIEIAERKHLKIAVDHTFLFTGAVRKIKELMDTDQVGSVYYYDSSRINLGLFQHDVNVVWDLAPHDFAIMLHLLKDRPEGIRAFGKSHINKFEDVAYIFVYFANNLVAHFNVNWLSPVKVRTTMIGGEKLMLVWNDMLQDEKVKVYDKGVEVKNKEGVYDMMVNYRTGNMYSPRIDNREALFVECSHFVDCILHDKQPLSGGKLGLEVVQLLHACEKSLKHNGGLVLL
jgi:predicted dehydrogenase